MQKGCLVTGSLFCVNVESLGLLGGSFVTFGGIKLSPMLIQSRSCMLFDIPFIESDIKSVKAL